MTWALGGWFATTFAGGFILGAWIGVFRANRLLYFAEAELKECQILRKQWALKIANRTKRPNKAPG